MSAASFDVPGAGRDLGSAAYRAEDFPGCESFHQPAGEIDRYDGRLEFWDGVTETAWKVCEPTSIYHEQPSRRLVRMAGQCAMLRGSAIECFGSADLVRLDAAGRKRWLMQADEVLYLPPNWRRLQGPAIEVDTDPAARCGAGGGPHDGRAPAQAGHLQGERVSGDLGAGAVGGVGARAGARNPCAPGGGIPGGRRAGPFRGGRRRRSIWRSEDPMSETAWRALERTALAMGEREGTTPQHDPLMASESARMQARGHAQGHWEGRAQGHREGHAEGHAEGRAEGHMDAVADILASRGIELSLDMTKHRELWSGIPGTAVVAAALACTSENDFRRRVREQARHAWAERPHPSASAGDLMRVPAGSSHRDRVPQRRRPAHGREPVAARRSDRRHQRARDIFRGPPGTSA